MANENSTATGGSALFGAPASFLPIDTSSAINFPSPSTKFRESTNEIEGKIWYELDVTDADTLVIIHDGKQVVIDKKDFLQKVGLEW